MRKALDSFFGLKKQHYLIKRDPESAALLREFTEQRPALLQISKKGSFMQSNIFALQHWARNNKNKNYYYCNLIGVVHTPGYTRMPAIAAWVEEFAREQNGAPGWILISILESKGNVREHIDSGLYFALRDRYHFVLQSTGSEMLSGGETALYKEGEVWWFNNRVPHTATNESDQERIHIIFDLLPNGLFARLKNVTWWIYWGLRPKRLWRYYLGRKFPHF